MDLIGSNGGVHSDEVLTATALKSGWSRTNTVLNNQVVSSEIPPTTKASRLMCILFRGKSITVLGECWCCQTIPSFCKKILNKVRHVMRFSYNLTKNLDFDGPISWGERNCRLYRRIVIY